MALAKYFEDIEERWLEGTSELYESRVAELFERFPVAPPPAGEVYLTRNGRRMEDIEVCERGQTLNLAVSATPGAAEPAVDLEEGGRLTSVELRTDGSFKLEFETAGPKQLRVSSGGYLKLYSIHVVEPFQVEKQPAFAQLIRAMSDNPPRWTDETFAEFHNDLETTLNAHAVPQIFIDGIVEYHLGLFHEEQRHAAYRERLQAAYGSLRWFIPYSDIARLICTQYLYCANEFSAALKLCRSGGSRLRRTLQLFLGQDDVTSQAGAAAHSAGEKKLQLLIALPDLLTFQAVNAIGDGHPDQALELCTAIHRDIVPAFDKERAARLAFLEACAREALGQADTAQKLFESLIHSPWQPIANAATRHLKDSIHG